jgi:hypothetical protein
MTLPEATEALWNAIQSEDLGAIARALSQRQAAIDSGQPVTEADLVAGELASQSLAGVKRKWAMEGARLQQLQSMLPPFAPAHPSKIVYRG